MATISAFLRSLASEDPDLWHRDPEAAMTLFGLDETQKGIIRRSQSTGDRAEVQAVIDAELAQSPQGAAKPFLWVK